MHTHVQIQHMYDSIFKETNTALLNDSYFYSHLKRNETDLFTVDPCPSHRKTGHFCLHRGVANMCTSCLCCSETSTSLLFSSSRRLRKVAGGLPLSKRQVMLTF